MSWKKGEGGRQDVRRRCERGAARWRGRSTSLGGVGGGGGDVAGTVAGEWGGAFQSQAAMGAVGS